MTGVKREREKEKKNVLFEGRVRIPCKEVEKIKSSREIMQMSCGWIESAQVGGDLELLSIEKWRLEKFEDFFPSPILSIDFACVPNYFGIFGQASSTYLRQKIFKVNKKNALLYADQDFRTIMANIASIA